MNKRRLKELPCTAPVWMLKKAKTTEKVTFLLRRKFQDIQTYELYLTGKLQKGDDIPEFIVFRDKHNWINYSPKEERWTYAVFENARVQMEVNQRIFYGTYNTDQYTILKNLRSWQSKILRKRYVKKKQNERERTEILMNQVPELPEDFEDFIENNLMKNANYIVYNRKKNEAYCTRCKKEYTLDELEIINSHEAKHMADYLRCPKCGIWVKQISHGMSRNKKGFVYGTEVAQLYGSGIIVREFTAYRNFGCEQSEKPRDMNTGFYEIHRFVITPQWAKKFEKIAGEWRDRTNKSFLTLGMESGKYYTEDIREIVEVSGLNYEGLGELVQEELDKQRYSRGIEHILYRVHERKHIEQMLKAGLKQLAQLELESNYNGYTVDVKATKLTKILGINKGELRILREQENQVLALKIMQMYHRNKRTVSRELIERVCSSERKRGEISIWDIEKLLDKNVTEEKALRYIELQNTSLSDFIDHLEMLEKLGIPRKKCNIYPSNFKEVHQEEIEEDILKNEEGISDETNEQFNKTYKNWKRLIRKYKITVHSGEYSCLLPASPLDIKIEGRCQHHCVGRYVDKATEGKSLIFYIRIAKEQRLYTAEYREGKLMQVRARYNGEPEKAARELAEQFAKELAAAERMEAEKNKKQMAEIA